MAANSLLLKRREFFTTAAAGAAAVGLPANQSEAAAPEALWDPVTYWGVPHRDGDEDPLFFHTSFEAASKQEYSDEAKPFEIEGLFPDRGQKFRLFNFEARGMQRSWFPRHLLDVPKFRERPADKSSATESDEQNYFVDEFWDREGALEAAAKLNAETMKMEPEAKSAADWFYMTPWTVVIEYGEFETRMLTTTEMWGERGIAEMHIHYPVRIVHPTDAEIARFGGKVAAA